jgi:hypothetical protein
VNQLPLKISGVKIENNGPNDFIKICMDQGKCCKALEYAMPVCGNEACKIYNLTYRPIFDTLSGKFWIMLDFKHLNTSESFNLKGNGKNYGIFEYSKLPVFLGPYFCKENLKIEYIISDAKIEGCQGAINVGVIQCPLILGTGSEDVSDWLIYKATGQTIIEIVSKSELTKNAEIEIFNSMGQKLRNKKITDRIGSFEFNIHELPAGIYFVKFTTGNRNYTKKIFAGMD